MSRQFDVFISYATADLDLVAPFVELLKRDNFRVWFDIEQMVGGPPAVGQLADAIADSAHTIACLSDAYFDRKWTLFELENSMNLDPAGVLARTIPVRFRPVRVMPNYLGHLTISDLTDQSNYERSYRRITHMIRQSAPHEPAPLDRAAVEQACDAPFQHAEDPNIALFQVRRASAAVAKFLYCRELGELPAGATLDVLIEQLVVSGKLPQDINAPLAILQTYGKYVVRDQLDSFAVTRESITPALTALTVLTEWVFPERKSPDPWLEIWADLPIGDDSAERQLPGTSYYLREPPVSRNSLGPLYAGRDAASNEPVSVNLVTLPPQSDDAFFAEVARFTQLSDASIVSPLDAGRVVVKGERRCLYLILPSIDAVSAQDLTEHFGVLPPRAAYELCLGIATALVGFHDAYPPIVHGDIKPANVLIGAFGTVRVLCIGREVAAAPATARSAGADRRIDSFFFASPQRRSGAPLTPDADLFALRSVLFYLLTGTYPAHEGGAEAAPQPADGTDPGQALDRLAGCQTAVQARRVLADACAAADGSPSLRSVNLGYREANGLLAEPRREPSAAASARQLALVDVCPIDSRKAFPIGAGRVLVMETGTSTLAVVEGSDLVWRDAYPVPVRLVTSGPGEQFAVGGWDGSVRYFSAGALSAAVKLDGAVGDLRFTDTGLVTGTWKRALWRISATGEHEELLAVDRGVHRIAVADRGNRFAVADLSGGLAIYANNRRVAHIPVLDLDGAGRTAPGGPPRPSITDLGYAGTRLIILADDTVASMRLDGSFAGAESKPGAMRLVPTAIAGCCLLLVETPGSRPSTLAVEVWLVDESDRHVRHFTLPAGHTLLSISAEARRLTLGGPGGGCSYHRDGAEVQAWPDAVAAAVSADGQWIAVSRPGRVELYEDPG